MRATTGRLSLSTTGRARMLLSVNFSKLIGNLAPPRQSDMRTARGHRLLDDTSAGREAAEARSLPQLDGTPEQCELSGISHRCIIMDVSAKVALADLGRAFSGHARCASRAAR